MIIGLFAGSVSCIGFARMKKWFYDTCGLHDTCGVHYLHGMPGLIGGVIGAIAAAQAGEDS